MRTLRALAVLAALGFGLTVTAEVNTTASRLDLSGTWQLRQTDVPGVAAIPMAVPGGVHSALLKAGKIPDPYFGRNELLVQWVGEKDWTVERTFTVPEALLAKKSVVLRLEEVDTFCDILINGKPAGTTGNYFCRYDFEVKQLLKPGENTITAKFRSPVKETEARAAKLPYPIPMSALGLVPHANLIRKPICNGGWDWGLSLMTVGFGGRVELLGADLARIDYVWCDQKISKDRADVTVHAVVTSPAGGETTFAAVLGDASSRTAVTLKPGRNELSAALTVKNPRLWWPNGSGEQALYDLKATVGDATLERKLGLRTVEIVNKPDADGTGMSMTFRINGVDTFMKGADWVPCDATLNGQTPEKVHDLLGSAAAANMNIVRLWGGGRFESDAFYETCDALGIMIWHDCMFACATYPSSPAFIGEVRAELEHQIPRLRDHAAIALWCGDNECLGALGWYPETKANRDRYLVGYDRLNRAIGAEIAKLDPSRIFWPSSPCGGPDDFTDGWHTDGRGDMHFWNVWHENKDFSNYYTVKPRFCSEFGFQSLSSPEVAATYCRPDQLNPTAPDCEYHQKNPGGNERILATMARYFRFPSRNPDDVFYLSQAQQALAIKTGVEGWRRLQPYCMGTIIWQLNDNWPVASWSSIEYGGKWKQLHYQAKRFYAPVAIFAAPSLANPSNIEVWVANDTDAALSTLEAIVDLTTFDGARVTSIRKNMPVKPHAAALVGSYPLSQFGTDAERLNRFLSLRLVSLRGRPFEYRNEWLFNPYKRCPIADAKVVLTSAAGKDGTFTVTLKTDKPAFFVWVNATGIRGEFDDNSFTLLPDASRTLTFTPKDPAVTFDQFQKALTVKHLRETY